MNAQHLLCKMKSCCLTYNMTHFVVCCVMFFITVTYYSFPQITTKDPLLSNPYSSSDLVWFGNLLGSCLILTVNFLLHLVIVSIYSLYLEMRGYCVEKWGWRWEEREEKEKPCSRVVKQKHLRICASRGWPPASRARKYQGLCYRFSNF
jgi:hypothetical protein